MNITPSELTNESTTAFAKWRNYETQFVEWLKAQNLIREVDGQVAFPVHGEDRATVVAWHYRKPDGSWRFTPVGTGNAPLTITSAAEPAVAYVGESQFDLFTAMQGLKVHEEFPPEAVFIASRGASNSRIVAAVCAKTPKVYVLAQNDEPGLKFMHELASQCTGTVLHVRVPEPHKDLNDWLRSGATSDDIRNAIAGATALRPQSEPASVDEGEDTASEKPDDREFPVDAFPGPVAAFVNAVSKTQRVPIALPAVCVLGVASAAIGAGLEAVSGASRSTRGNLFLVASAESGSGKSETFKFVAAPLLEHQKQVVDTWRQKTQPSQQSEVLVLEKEIAVLEKKAANAENETQRERFREQLEHKIVLKQKAERSTSPPCIVAQDVTTERLATLLYENGEVTFSASADARKLVDNLRGRYSPGKTTDESLYLSGYSGDYIRVDRQSREPVILHRPCIALTWLVQPDMLADMLGEDSLSASGFLPRVLPCHTKATPNKIVAEHEVFPENIRAAWESCVSDLIQFYYEAPTPHRINATPEARQRLDDFHNRIVEQRMGPLADVGIFAARYAENAWRIAVVLHALLHGVGAMTDPLGEETAMNAIRIMEWFIDQQLNILAKGRQQAAEKVEAEVFALLEIKKMRIGEDFVTARDVQRKHITTTSEAAQHLLERMVSEGLLVPTDVQPLGGGKVTRQYRAAVSSNPVPG